MLIEQLFARGVMTMGPSPRDPNRQVGVFPSELITEVAKTRAAELEKFRWIAGSWSYENHVPATAQNPAYVDAGRTSYSVVEMNGWICANLPDGRQEQQITFDPFSKQWIFVLTRGSYGILRSPDGWTDNQIIFTGPLTMIGVDCEWRMSWTKTSEDEFQFVNEEKNEEGGWTYIDEWRFIRTSATTDESASAINCAIASARS